MQVGPQLEVVDRVEESLQREVAFADAVNAVAADPRRARSMGAAGRARAVSEFGWDAIADETIAVYSAALRA